MEKLTAANKNWQVSTLLSCSYLTFSIKRTYLTELPANKTDIYQNVIMDKNLFSIILFPKINKLTFSKYALKKSYLAYFQF